MLAELKFVQGSVAKKDFLPALTHFVIEKGIVRGFNGTIALCSPIQLDIACKPKAESLVKAINNCNDMTTTTLTMTPAGRLRIQSGTFRAFIDCLPQETETPHAEPEGKDIEINGAQLVQALKIVQPFIGDDASRPWSNGVLLREQSAFATNNVSLVQYWVGSVFPVTVNLPRAAVKEIVRIKEAPVRAQCTDRSFTLHYSDGRWLRTQLLMTDWPNLDPILDDKASTQKAIDPAVFEGLAAMRPFVDKLGRIFFGNGGMHTHEGDEGASFTLDGEYGEGVYNLEILQSLEGQVKTIDWSMYPKPCIFYGDNLRGALIGMRR